MLIYSHIAWLRVWYCIYTTVDSTTVVNKMRQEQRAFKTPLFSRTSFFGHRFKSGWKLTAEPKPLLPTLKCHFRTGNKECETLIKSLLLLFKVEYYETARLSESITCIWYQHSFFSGRSYIHTVTKSVWIFTNESDIFVLVLLTLKGISHDQC